MTNLDENFRVYLTTVPGINDIVGDRVHCNYVPQESAPPYIWLRRSGVEQDQCLDDPQGDAPLNESFDVELWTKTPDELYNSSTGLVQAFRQATVNYTGPMGTTNVRWSEMVEQDSDYQPRGFSDVDSAAASYNESFSVDIWEAH